MQARDAGHRCLYRKGDEALDIQWAEGRRLGVDLDLLVGDVRDRVDRQAHELEGAVGGDQQGECNDRPAEPDGSVY